MRQTILCCAAGRALPWRKIYSGEDLVTIYSCFKMSHCLQFLLLIAVVAVGRSHVLENSDLKSDLKRYKDEVDGLSEQLMLHQKSYEEKLESLTSRIENEQMKYKNILSGLTDQLMMQQLANEESVRAGGNSGIKQVRNYNTGTRSYFSATHTNNREVFNIHEHSNYERTAGIGEVDVVMNGLEFRTRHNDYLLFQPHRTETEYHSLEGIEYPPVPPSVLELNSLDDQMAELKKYFNAWKDQDTSQIDYRPYFKPVMCYMEGAWTIVGDKIEDYISERHHIDAATWAELLEKVSFNGYSGHKSNKENNAFLPTKIFYGMKNNTAPVVAQWNYRIMCAPVTDIPTHFFRPIDDLATRIGKQKTLEEYAKTPRARFFLHDFDESKMDEENFCYWCYIDSVMAQVPGKDNYKGNLSDTAYGMVAMEGRHPDNDELVVLNTAYYHRYYRSTLAGAQGWMHRVRGFSDGQLYMAQTSHEKIPSLSVTDCEDDICTEYEQRWTYAIPLEIIYLTPLYNWNPYNIKMYREDDPDFDNVYLDGRNGGLTPETAYDGNQPSIYYHTPKDFFIMETPEEEEEIDPASTGTGLMGVLDQQGIMREVVGSGTRVILREIPGVGKLRTRYPIAPLYNEGSQIYKELDVLKDLVLRKDKYQHLYY